ncbi:MAG: hypothetical protein VYE57_00540 [SAR324 cluster bacterium]|nr:hypothetical protein [SAR324 cluster bacterium]
MAIFPYFWALLPDPETTSLGAILPDYRIHLKMMLILINEVLSLELLYHN